MADFAPVSGWTYKSYTFQISGMVALGTKLDGTRTAERSFTITEARLHVETNGGAAGSTTIDINIDGVSIFLPANRPTIAFNAGNNITTTSTPDTTALTADSMVTMDVDTVVAGGFISDLTVELEVRGRA